MRPKGCDPKLAGVFVCCFQVTQRFNQHDDVIELNSRRIFQLHGGRSIGSAEGFVLERLTGGGLGFAVRKR